MATSGRDFLFIQDDRAFRDYHKDLRDHKINAIAMDFEGEFNLHVYGNHLCLIQIFDGKRFVAVDPFKVAPESLKAFFEDRAILKIMYDCASDGSLLFDNYGIILRSVLDLRPVPDLLNFEKKDLSSVLNVALGLDVIKKKQFQMHNWMRRPIDHEAMDYALDDVAELFRLKDWMFARLLEQGLLDEYIRRNMAVQHEGRPKENKKPRIMKTPDFESLDATKRKRFMRVYEAREEIAKRLNLPPNTVVANAELFEIARTRLAVAEIRFNRQIADGAQAGIRQELEKALAGKSD